MFHRTHPKFHGPRKKKLRVHPGTPCGQPFINRCLVISNHFLCKDSESSIWWRQPLAINGWPPWGSRHLMKPWISKMASKNNEQPDNFSYLLTVCSEAWASFFFGGMLWYHVQMTFMMLLYCEIMMWDTPTHSCLNKRFQHLGTLIPSFAPEKRFPRFPKNANPTDQLNASQTHLSQPGDRSTCRLEAPKIECQSLDHHLGLLGNLRGPKGTPPQCYVKTPQEIYNKALIIRPYFSGKQWVFIVPKNKALFSGGGPLRFPWWFFGLNKTNVTVENSTH